MVRGIYTAVSGMELAAARQEAVAQNVANIETPGYRRQRVLGRPQGRFQVYLADAQGETPLGEVTLGVRSGGAETDFSLGSLRRTGRPLHAAIEGEGFFAVQGKEGVFYTRDGSFGLDAQGYLVLWGVAGRGGESVRVLGRDGQPLRLSSSIEGEVQITPEGSLVAGGQVVGELRVVRFSEEERRALVRRGKNLFAAPSEGEAVTPRLRPGYLELANVDPAGEMVEMMALSRIFEACQRAVLAQDGLLERAINEMGRGS